MSKQLYHIRQKINAIQHGLLRFRDEKERISLQARTTVSDDTSLNCIILEEFPAKDLINRDVSILHKSHYDFLYILGTVDEEANNGAKILSIRIRKASWFVHKVRGNQSWFQQKYIFEEERQEGAV